jgi:hypothetical protein
MAQCVYCKAETSLYEGGTPICTACCDEKDARRQKARATSAPHVRATRPMDSEAGMMRSSHSENSPEA